MITFQFFSPIFCTLLITIRGTLSSSIFILNIQKKNRFRTLNAVYRSTVSCKLIWIHRKYLQLQFVRLSFVALQSKLISRLKRNAMILMQVSVKYVSASLTNDARIHYRKQMNRKFCQSKDKIQFLNVVKKLFVFI